MKKVLMIALLLVAATVLSFATGTSEEAAEGPGGVITLYTSVPQSIIDKIQADFMDRYPTIDLEVFRAGTGSVVAKIATELEAGQVLADLIWVAEPSTYESFKDRGILLQFTPEEASALAEGMADPDGYYYAGRLINMIIGYNKGAVSRPPRTWEDLLTDAYDGPKAMASPVTSGAALAAAYAIGREYGEDYFVDFKENGGVQARSNGTVRDALATGEYTTGIVLDYMMRSGIESGSPVGYVWPRDGAVFIPSPIAIINTSKNIEAAKVFVDYALSVEGQETLVELGNFIPVRTDVEPPADAAQVNEINSLEIDWKALREEADSVRDTWERLFAK
jgi:iron(III) transport system substrate-binding protein